MAQISLKGSYLDPTLLKSFKNFDEFYKWADPRYKGDKKEFEELFYKFHDKPKGAGK